MSTQKKKKKIHLTKLTLILLTALTLCITNCSNEQVEVIELTEIQQLQNKFTLENFDDNFVKDNLEIDWDNYIIKEDVENDYLQYEFNTLSKVNKNILSGKQKFELKYKLLVTKKASNSFNYEIIKFIANDDKSLVNVSYFSPELFSGTLYHFNLKGETIRLKAYKNGVKINEVIDEKPV